MALKPDRNTVDVDISFFMNEVAEPGGVVTFSTVGSGAAMDQANALVTYATYPSGKQPVGFLMSNMVNIDQTKQSLNWHKNDVQKGGKVTLLTAGWVVTNRIRPNTTPAAGDFAYLAESGMLTPTPQTQDNEFPIVGRFLSRKDDEGYAKVQINTPLPMVRGTRP